MLPVSMVNLNAIMQIMRETLIYLSHLDHEDTEKQVRAVTELIYYNLF
jgi:hypothetical protein